MREKAVKMKNCFSKNVKIGEIDCSDDGGIWDVSLVSHSCVTT